MLNLLKKPLLHCLAIGGLIAAIQFSNQPPTTIILSQQEIVAFKDEFKKTFGAGQDIDTFIASQQLAEDEILYLEAKAAGFDKTDAVITRLVNVAEFLQLAPRDSTMDEKYQAALAMRLDETDIVARRQMITLFKTVLKNSSTLPPASEQQIQQWYDQHADQYQQKSRYAFSHVYLQQNSENNTKVIAKLQRSLAADFSPDLNNIKPVLDKAIAMGDVFYGGHYFPLQNKKQIARHFGESFSNSMSEAPLQQWSQAIPSAFGLHFIWISETTPQTPKPLASVRRIIERELNTKAEDVHYQQQLEKLKNRYRILIEGADGEHTYLLSSPTHTQQGAN